jgi:hypothetical protein
VASSIPDQPLRASRADEGLIDICRRSACNPPEACVFDNIAQEASLNAPRQRAKHIAARARVGFNQKTAWRANRASLDSWRTERYGDEGESLCKGARRE